MIPQGKIGCTREYRGENRGWTVSWITGADFHSEDPKKRKEALDWAHDLAHPWFEEAVFYEVSPAGASVVVNPNNEKWIAEYTSVIYDTIECIAIAYGATPLEALQNVIDLVEELIKTYNKEDQP